MPLSTQVYKWVPAKCWGVTLRWTSIPSRGEQKYSQSLHAIETGISSALMGHYARRQTLPLPFSYFDRPKYDCTRKLKKLGRYSNCSSTMSCYRSEKSHFVLLVTCYSCWHFTCRLRVILLFLFQFFGVLFFQANCSMLHCCHCYLFRWLARSGIHV